MGALLSGIGRESVGSAGGWGGRVEGDGPLSAAAAGVAPVVVDGSGGGESAISGGDNGAEAGDGRDIDAATGGMALHRCRSGITARVSMGRRGAEEGGGGGDQRHGHTGAVPEAAPQHRGVRHDTLLHLMNSPLLFIAAERKKIKKKKIYISTTNMFSEYSF